VADEIARGGGSATGYGCDVTLQPEVFSAFEKITQQGQLDILVNNAGVSHIGNVESTTEAEFDRVLKVNVKGYYNCIFAAV